MVTHPFHPLRGQSFAVLKTRRSSGTLILVLAGTSRGTFTVPLEWTDRAFPPSVPTAPATLEPSSLLELADLVQRLAGPAKKGVAS